MDDALRRYEPVIGLEVHAQLSTVSKLFCGCATAFGGEPNHNTCPLCMGMPGTLPVLNKKAVEHAVRFGLAVGGAVAPRSVFARKNYFYPDLPKGYQISQFEHPIIKGGAIWIEADGQRRRIELTRAHMEEDSGKSSHGKGGSSLVDLNRAGIPLLEIVSEPQMHSAEQAIAYMKALRSIVRYIEICDGNMEEGSFRCDANISLRLRGSTTLGTRTELKNINSFRFVGQAINHEIVRQAALLDAGEPVRQQTRLWDTSKHITVFMRSKEDAQDYRYFPEPDLPPLVLEPSSIEALRSSLPELPDARAQRYQEQFLLPAYDAGVLTADRALAEYFEAGAAAVGGEPGGVKAICNWIMGDVLRELKEEDRGIHDVPFGPEHIAELVELIKEGVISGKIAKQVFAEMWGSGQPPGRIVEARGWRQVSDEGAIDEAIREAMAAHPKQLGDLRGGKVKLKGFFVGQVMKAMRGQANPGLVNSRLDALLLEGTSID